MESYCEYHHGVAQSDKRGCCVSCGAPLRASGSQPGVIKFPTCLSDEDYKKISADVARSFSKALFFASGKLND